MGEDNPIKGLYIEDTSTGAITPFDKIREIRFTTDWHDIIEKIIYNANKTDPIMNYEYTTDEANNMAITTIYWRDCSTTTCRAPLDKADQYTGFMIAVAKRAMGNHNEATNAADYWINKRPAQLKKIAEKEDAAEAEERRLEDKRRKRKEKYRLHIAAVRRKEAYEAAKLANEKYGVPLDFKEDGGDK